MPDPTSAPTAITVTVLLAAVGLKLTDLAKYVVVAIKGPNRLKAVNGMVTLIVTAVLSYLFVQFLLKPSSWGDEIRIGNESLQDLDRTSTIIFGIVFSGIAGTLYDFKKAIDEKDSAKKPKFVSNSDW